MFGTSVLANAVHGSSTADKAHEAIQTFIGDVPEEEGEGEGEGGGRQEGGAGGEGEGGEGGEEAATGKDCRDRRYGLICTHSVNYL